MGLTSDRKIKANRANARASTGPKTAEGRARTAKNALRYALSIPVCSNPALSEEVETLAREIAGPGANAETKELARRVAEAQIDLRFSASATRRASSLVPASARPGRRSSTQAFPPPLTVPD